MKQDSLGEKLVTTFREKRQNLEKRGNLSSNDYGKELCIQVRTGLFKSFDKRWPQPPGATIPRGIKLHQPQGCAKETAGSSSRKGSSM